MKKYSTHSFTVEIIIEKPPRLLLSAPVAYINTLQPKALAESLLGIACLATVPLCVKATQADAIVIGIVRLGVAAALVALFFVPAKQWRQLVAPQTWPQLLTIGLLFGLHWILYFWAIKLSNASLGSIGLSTYSISVMGISFFLQRHRPSLAEWLMLGLAFLGTFLVIPQFSLQNQYTLGFLLAILSGFVYAWLPFLHQKTAHISLSLRTLGQYIFALPVFLIFLPQAQWRGLTSQDWQILAILATVGTFFGHSLWVRATSRLPTQSTRMLYFLYLPASVLLSTHFLGETLSPSILLGAALVLGSSACGVYLQWKQQKNHSTIKNN